MDRIANIQEYTEARVQSRQGLILLKLITIIIVHRTFSFGTDRYHFCGADRYNQFRTFRDNYNVEQIENRYCRTIVKQKGNISKEQAKFAIMKQTDISFEKGKVNFCLIDKDNYFKIDRIYYTLYSVQCTCILEVS